MFEDDVKQLYQYLLKLNKDIVHASWAYRTMAYSQYFIRCYEQSQLYNDYM